MVVMVWWHGRLSVSQLAVLKQKGRVRVQFGPRAPHSSGVGLRHGIPVPFVYLQLLQTLVCTLEQLYPQHSTDLI